MFHQSFPLKIMIFLPLQLCNFNGADVIKDMTPCLESKFIWAIFIWKKKTCMRVRLKDMLSLKYHFGILVFESRRIHLGSNVFFWCLTNWIMDLRMFQYVLYIIIFKEYIWISSNEVDETGAYYTEWSKPERKTPIQYTNAYIWNLERW